jgi:integrase/recombinase XerD
MSETRRRVRFSRAVDLFVDQLRLAGRITSDSSERAYRDVLDWHAEDSETPDVRKTTREDVRKTLRRWSGNTQVNRHSILAAFYRWLVQEGYRKENPADQLPRARKRKPDPPRLRRDEALALTMACETARERRVVYLGLFAGLRNQELRGLQGRHFERPGLIWVSPDIAKGGRPRWLPVLDEVRPVVDEIRANTGSRAFVIPAQRRNPRAGEWYDLPDQQCSSQAVWRLVNRVAERAGVEATPHTLRRAFADMVERQAGVRVAQKLLGHATLATTEGYLSEPTLDELQGAVSEIALASSRRSKARTRPSSSHIRTQSPSTSTVTGSVSISLSRDSTAAKTSASIGAPPRGFEPRFPP